MRKRNCIKQVIRKFSVYFQGSGHRFIKLSIKDEKEVFFMRQNINEDRQEVISIEEYLRKRGLIREREISRKSNSASQKSLRGEVMELAELYI